MVLRQVQETQIHLSDSLMKLIQQLMVKLQKRKHFHLTKVKFRKKNSLMVFMDYEIHCFQWVSVFYSLTSVKRGIIPILHELCKCFKLCGSLQNQTCIKLKRHFEKCLQSAFPLCILLNRRLY